MPSPTDTSPLSSLFADRAAKCSAEQARQRAAERAEQQRKVAAERAKADARKAALLADPTSARAIQAKHAEEVAAQLAKEKRERQEVLRKIEGDKREREQREREKREKRRRDEQARAGGGRYEWDYEEGRAVNVGASRLVGGNGGGGEWRGNWGYYRGDGASWDSEW